MSTEEEVAPEEIPEKPVTEQPRPAPSIDEVTIRSYPKTVLFYPTMLVSLVLGLLDLFAPPLWKPAIGFVWFVIFTFNLLVVSFEFGKTIVVALISFLVIVILGAALLFTAWGFTFWINPVYLGLVLNANSLVAFFLVFGFVILISWLSTRFFYFRVTHNEIIYKKGILGDVERYATSNVTVHKEIRDIFEYVLFASGRLTIEVPGRKLAITIDNVPRINRVEHRVLHLLGRIEIDRD
jgi:hypothetical protein